MQQMMTQEELSEYWNNRLDTYQTEGSRIAKILGTQTYLFVADHWVGQFDVLDEQYHRWIFCGREHREYASRKNMKDVTQMKDNIDINLMRAEIFMKTTKTGAFQAGILAIVFMSVTWMMTPRVSTQNHNHNQNGSNESTIIVGSK